MVATLSATVQPDLGYVNLQLNGVTPQTTVGVYRIDGAGNFTAIRNGDPAPIDGQSWFGQDYEAPLDVNVYYTVRDPLANNALIADSQVVNLASGGRPWLGHPGKPSLNMRPTVGSFTPGTRASRAAIHDVIGRNYPVAQTLRRASLAGTMMLRLSGTDELNALHSILDDGHVLLLRAPSTWVGLGANGSRYIQVGDAEFAPLIRTLTDGRYTATLPWTEVDRPAGLAQGGVGFRWVDVTNVYSSWLELMADNAAWSDVIDGVATA